MKKTMKVILAILVAATVVTGIIPANLAKADSKKMVEEVTVIPKNDTEVKYALVYSRVKWYSLNETDYSPETFRPSDNITYGELAQWIYCGTNKPEKSLSQKKALKWVRNAYYEVALAHPEYAEEIATAFSDGKERLSYKKAASLDWIRATFYTMAWYNNDGAWFNGYDEFDFDIYRVDRLLATGGAERDSGNKYDNDYIRLYYSHKWENFNKDTNHLSRIATLDVLNMLNVPVLSTTPPWNWKGR